MTGKTSQGHLNDFANLRIRLGSLLLNLDARGLLTFLEELSTQSNGFLFLDGCLPDGDGIVGEALSNAMLAQEIKADPLEWMAVFEGLLKAGFSPLKTGGSEQQHAGGRLVEAVEMVQTIFGALTPEEADRAAQLAFRLLEVGVPGQAPWMATLRNIPAIQNGLSKREAQQLDLHLETGLPPLRNRL